MDEQKTALECFSPPGRRKIEDTPLRRTKLQQANKQPEVRPLSDEMFPFIVPTLTSLDTEAKTLPRQVHVRCECNTP